MTENRVSADLSPDEQEFILSSLKTIQEKLSFLIGLSAAERKRLCHMGDKSRAFVLKALELATQNDELLPRCLDVDELRRDVDLLDALYPIMLSMAKLQELIEDTYRQVGSEAYASARMVYKSARANGENMGVSSSLEEMGRRFAKSRKASDDAPALID
ncbi:MAG TPA: hypothetical protein ACFE0H_16425 [Elainellaceae cyanobacterium]|jgi:hypothetical protein